MESTNPKDIDARTQNRLRFHVIPPIAKVWLAEALEEGADKYGVFNWREQSVSEATYLDAMERHLTQLQDGEWFDRKTGKPHLGYIMACSAILADAYKEGMLVPFSRRHNGELMVDIWTPYSPAADRIFERANPSG